VLARLAGPIAIVGVGLVTFAIVFVTLQLTGAEPRVLPPPQPVSAPTAGPGPAVDSVAARIPPNQVAVGVPTAGWEPLLRSVRVGDRLNVMASLASPDANSSGPVTAVVISGARVLQPASPDAPMLLEMPPSDAVVVAHLVLGGTPLAFAVLPAGGTPSGSKQLDEDATRNRLGLAPRPSPTPAPLPTPVLEPTPTVPASAPREEKDAGPAPLPDRYVVQPGQTLSGIAAELGVDEGALWWANRQLIDPNYLMAGMELVVPKFRGFVYQVRPATAGSC
jgi:hypothetical protein